MIRLVIYYIQKNHVRWKKCICRVIIERMDSEKRKFYRHPIKVPIQLTEEASESITNSRAEDLSQGGLSFFWPHSIAGDTLLLLTIPVEKQLFKMHARVAYSQKDDTSDLFKIGVCFEDPTSAFRAKLAEEILQIRQYQEKMSILRGKTLSEEDAAKLWIERNAKEFSKLIGN